MKQQLEFTVNGEQTVVFVEPWRTLLEVLRDELRLKGVKSGCSSGSCGACTVLIDGRAVKSCLVLALQTDGRNILTVEGLASGSTLHPLQQSFIDHFAVQCGYCTAGMMLSAKALLDENPSPTEEEVREGLRGNLCRCTGYKKIVEAILACSRKGGRA